MESTARDYPGFTFATDIFGEAAVETAIGRALNDRAWVLLEIG
jgi:hypothetical protein